MKVKNFPFSNFSFSQIHKSRKFVLSDFCALFYKLFFHLGFNSLYAILDHDFF